MIVITKGPWRIRTAVVGDDSAAISYRIDDKSEVIASETHEDLVLLRDAITEYLEAAHQASTDGAPYPSHCLDCDSPLGEPTAHDGRRGCPECGTYFALPNGVTWATFNRECGTTEDGDDDCG